jgi:hypothetical protein
LEGKKPPPFFKGHFAGCGPFYYQFPAEHVPDVPAGDSIDPVKSKLPAAGCEKDAVYRLPNKTIACGQ